MKVAPRLVLCLCLLGSGWAAGAQSAVPATEVEAAVEQLRADPNLMNEKTERVLRWKEKDKAPEPKPTDSAWTKWLKNFVAWLNKTGRVLMWVVGGLLALFALWAVRRWWVNEVRVRGRVNAIAPTHVQDLDIRPDSLPDDIGAAAWQAWQRATESDWASRRAALSLLYRGALSRLVHGFAVPIAASSTEGECVALARAVFSRLGEDSGGARSQYVAQLIEVWVRAVYGLQPPTDSLMQRLCQEFAPHLTAVEPTHAA